MFYSVWHKDSYPDGSNARYTQNTDFYTVALDIEPEWGISDFSEWAASVNSVSPEDDWGDGQVQLERKLFHWCEIPSCQTVVAIMSKTPSFLDTDS